MKNKKLQLEKWGRGFLAAFFVGVLGFSQDSFAKTQKVEKQENTKIWEKNLGTSKNEEVSIKKKKDVKDKEGEWKEVLGVEEVEDKSAVKSVEVNLKKKKNKK